MGTGLLCATTDFTNVTKCDAVLIAVPTPLNRNREPDMSFIVNTCEALVPHLRRGQLIVLESTTYPGTTDEVMVPDPRKERAEGGQGYLRRLLSRTGGSRTQGLFNGNDSEGRRLHVSRGAGQLRKKCTNRSSCAPSRSHRTAAAEATKILENTFRAVNIALVNELKVTFMKMGIDVWEVIEAAKTKPFGFMPFYPGPGLGGHCIPIDPVLSHLEGARISK